MSISPAKRNPARKSSLFPYLVNVLAGICAPIALTACGLPPESHQSANDRLAASPPELRPTSDFDVAEMGPTSTADDLLVDAEELSARAEALRARAQALSDEPAGQVEP
jgi:hypothetical protein